MIKNQQALLNYFSQRKPGIDVGRTVKLSAFINDYTFWHRLKIVKEILDPIHKIQYMSEAENYLLYRVACNWNWIRSHLYSKVKEYEDIGLKQIADEVWEDRYLNQFTELHVVSALLNPVNHNIRLVGVSGEQAFGPIMYRFFDRFLSNEEDAALAMKSWLSFRNQEEEFHSSLECWAYANKPDLFWTYCRGFAEKLSTLAKRVIKIPAKSVLAERSWSIMNLILNKARNSIGASNVDMLMYIYMNERTLNRPIDAKERLQYTMGIELDESDLCEMEDRLIQEELSLTQQSIEIENNTHQSIGGDEEDGGVGGVGGHKRMASKELEHEIKRPSIA